MSFFQGHRELHRSEDISRKESSIQHESQNAKTFILWVLGIPAILLIAFQTRAIQFSDVARRETIQNYRESQPMQQQPNYTPNYQPWGN